MSNELVIPPDISPESPSRIVLVDDQTVSFVPQFSRRWSQRNTFADPRWRLTHRYRGLRQKDSARMHAVVSEAQGAYRTVMVSPGMSNRGSFATTYSSELFTNSDFASGTTGWSANNLTLSSADASLRIIVSGTGVRDAYQNVTLTQYAPFALRVLDLPGRGTAALSIGPYLDDGVSSAFDVTSVRGYHVASRTSLNSGSRKAAISFFSSTNGYVQNDFIDVPFVSIARCALVDAGGNLFTQSKALEHADWVRNDLTGVTANAANGPDGVADADKIIPSAANNQHYIYQSKTVSSTAQDIEICGYFMASGYNFVRLYMSVSSAVYQTFNLGTGAVGTTSSIGGAWSNLRASIVNMGGGWYFCSLIAYKSSSDTAIDGLVIVQNADNASSFVGDTTSGILGSAVTLFQSSQPSVPIASTTAAVAAQTASGSRVQLKGLPISQDGLLVPGDWVEIDGQLKRVTAALNSDAAGRGYLQVRPKVYREVADNTPVIVTKPLGRFALAGDVSLDAMFGMYSDYELTFEEVYE